MLNKNNNEIIKIAILEISDQNKAILEFYFNTAGKSLYKEVNKEEATAFITDYDYPGAIEHWTEISKTSNKPGLILSISKKQVPSTIWLAKPLTAKAITEAAVKIREMINTEIVAEEVVAVPAVQETKIVEDQASDDAIQRIEIENQPFEEAVNIETVETTKETLVEELTAKESDLQLDVIEEKQITAVMVAKTNVEKHESAEKLAGESELAMATVGTSELVATSMSETTSEILPEIDKQVEHRETDEVVPIANEQIQSTQMLDIDLNTNEKKEEHETSIEADDQEIETLETSQSVNKIAETPKLTENEEIDLLLESLIQGEGMKKQSAGKNKRTFKENKVLPLLTEATPDSSENTKEETSLNTAVFDEGKRLDPEDEFSDKDSFSVEGSLPVNDSLPVSDSLSIEDSVPVAGPGVNEDPIQSSENKDSEKKDFSSFDFASFEAPASTETVSNEVNSNKGQDALTTELENNTESDLFDFNLDSLISDETEPASEKVIEDDGSALGLADHRVTEVEDDFSELLADAVLTRKKPASKDSTAKATKAVENSLDSEFDQDPGIAVAVAEENAIPLTAEQELQSLLNEIRTEADKSSAGKKPKSSKFTYGEIPLHSRSEQEKTHQPTNADKRWTQLCGSNDDIHATQDLKGISYTLNNHMLSVLLDQIDHARSSKHVLRLKHDDIIIVIDTEFDSIYCNYSAQSEDYSDFCYKPVNTDNIKIHALDYSEVRLYRKKMNDDLNRTHSIESFIWTTSLLTSRGRLLEHTDITKKISLKAWPNLTRLEKTPHAMNIAAVFSKHPGSLQDVPKWLNIPQRYVFAFYNAAISLEMVEFDSNKFKTSTFIFDTDNISENSAKERGFFGRLLKRLTA
jgi:hypothetical protein